ncbi:MAG: hypothetical protein GY861_24475 [bacterium]|nr:hypothetical protein [bacterium]
MPPVQTSYEAEHDPAFVGQRTDLGLTNIISKVAESAAIAFGLAVVRGTADDQCILPSAAGQDFLGVSEYTSAWTVNESDEHVYEQYREVNIIDFGQVWVSPETSVVPGDKVFYRHTAPGVEVIGSFRNDDDGGNATEIIGATFETTASIDGLAVIRLMPNVNGLDIFEDVTAVSGALSLLTEVSLFDTTLGASTSTLADGYEGQRKVLKMSVDGGDMVVTPANFADATSLTFHSVGNVVELEFVDGAWNVISIDGAFLDTDVITVTAASGAIPLTAKIVLFDSSVGASTSTLAAGYEGQRILFKMTVDGGDQVLTPTLFVDGAIVTFDNADYIELLSDGTNWMSVGTPTAAIS